MARKWLIRFAFFFLSLGAVYFIALFIVGRVADRRIEAELAAIRQKGEPLLLTEMAPPPLLDQENAAELLQLAAMALGDEADEESDAADRLMEDPRGCSDGTTAILKNLLDRHQPALEAIDNALLRPGCRFDYDYSSAMALLEESEFGAFDFINCASLLTFRGALAVRDGKTSDAYDDVLRTLRVGQFASSDPMLLHAMARSSCEMKALTLLNAALEQEPPDQERREKLLTALDSIDARGYLRRALLGERCFGRSMFEMFPDHRDQGGIIGALSFADGEFPGLLSGIAPSALIRLDQARYLNLMSRMIDLCRRPPFETEDDWVALEQDLHDHPWYALLSRLTIVPMRSMNRTIEAHRARLDLARIALDLEHAKKVTGQLPDTILIPATEGHRGSIDPFSGRDYRFRTTGDGGYVIWSVGPDGVDDQGTDGQEDGYDDGDVVWER